jgi:Kef-type K+ transport system membrane component KefB
MANVALYRDLALVFSGAVLGGLVAHRLRQPTILGYDVAGIMLYNATLMASLLSILVNALLVSAAGKFLPVNISSETAEVSA